MSLVTTLTYALPHRALSAFARALAQSSTLWLKQWLIDTVIAKFGVDMSEAAQPDPRAYPSFNAFFTRALRADARPADPDPRALLMPADGFISQCGVIGHAEHGAGHIFQAKGRGFSAGQLLADEAAAARFEGGSFATVYLSPRDYHRVHMPWSGTLRETVHVPGRLFSVGTDAVERVPGLFARNERLVCHFDCDFGPMALVMVGALLVSGVETVWGGVEIPPYASDVIRKDYAGQGIHLERFAEMARFNYGSTVIVLLPAGVAALTADLAPEAPVNLGQSLAILRGH